MANKLKNLETTTIDGVKHASVKEANRWCELKLLERYGVIKDLQRQVKYVLIPTQYETYERYSKHGKRLKDGKTLIEKECAYYADFVYTDVATGQKIVEDTKGYKNPSSATYAKFVIKRKLMLYIYHIKIKEV